MEILSLLFSEDTPVFMFNTDEEGASSRCHLYSWSKEGWCGRWEMMVGEEAALQLPAQESTNAHNLKYRRDSSMHRGIGLLHYRGFSTWRQIALSWEDSGVYRNILTVFTHLSRIKQASQGPGSHTCVVCE